MSEPRGVPRGFLFADLRGYSAWVERHGDRAAADLIREYRRLVRAEVERFGGAEIRTEGDSFYVVFTSANAAIECGLAIQQAARVSTAGADVPPMIGIGVHAGETVETDEGYVGSAVNIAARVCAVARPGELLVTDTVRALTRTLLDVDFEPRGRRRLKGIQEPVRLFAVVPGDATLPSPRRLPLVIGGVLAVSVAAALAVAVTAFLGSATESSNGGNGRAASSATPGASVTPSAMAVGTAFPTSAEEQLLARLPATIARHCRRAATDDIPPHHPDFFDENRPPPLIPLSVTAALRCPIGGATAPSVVYYFHARTARDIDEAFFQRASEYDSAPGDCTVFGTVNAHGSWTLGELEGRVLCGLRAGTASFLWTYRDEGVVAQADRSDGDIEALRRWWRDHRLMGPG